MKRLGNRWIWRLLAPAFFLDGTQAQDAVNVGEPPEIPVREVEINVVPGRPMFTVRRLTARPGEKFRFKVKNTGKLPMNFVISSEGTWREVADLVNSLGEQALDMDFNPGPPFVTHALPLMRAGEEGELEWSAPETRGKVATFLSSVPGHAASMHGHVIVFAQPSLKDLSYAYYEGTWEAEGFPDFGLAGDPVRAGDLAGDRIDFDAIPVLAERAETRKKAGHQAALVISGLMRIPFMGNYDFALSSNAHARLAITDAVDIQHDGSGKTVFEPASSELDDGVFGLGLELVGSEISKTPGVAFRGPEGVVSLSTGQFDPFTWPDQFVIERGPYDDEPLAVSVPMPGAAELALAVSLTSGVNYCFDPETLCVRYAWSGRFLDARPNPDDGSGRLGGNCKPLGKILNLGGDSTFPLRLGKLGSDGNDVTYLGHSSGSKEEDPELVFKVGETTVFQRVSATRNSTPNDIELEYVFRFSPPPDSKMPIMFYADSREVTVTSESGFAKDGVVLFTLPEGEDSVSVALKPVSAGDPKGVAK